MAGNNSIDNFVFYENVSSLDGLKTKIFDVRNNADSMTLKFVCTNGTFEARVLADIITKNPIYPWPVFKLPKYELIDDDSVISDASRFYSIDLKGIDYIKIEITSLSGEISIYGKATG